VTASITSRIGKAGVALMLSMGALAATGRKASVAAVEGNLYITLASGERREITSSGRDYDPSLSLDGRYVVFARAVPGPPFDEPPQPRGPQRRSELWMVGADGKDPRRLFSGEVRGGNFRYVEFSAPRLSLDNRYVYFMIPLAAVCGGLVSLDLRTSQVRILTPAIGLTMLDKGAYRGYMVVVRRVDVPIDSEGQGGGTYPFWLYAPNGVPIREIGGDQAGERFIRENR